MYLSNKPSLLAIIPLYAEKYLDYYKSIDNLAYYLDINKNSKLKVIYVINGENAESVNNASNNLIRDYIDYTNNIRFIIDDKYKCRTFHARCFPYFIGIEDLYLYDRVMFLDADDDHYWSKIENVDLGGFDYIKFNYNSSFRKDIKDVECHSSQKHTLLKCRNYLQSHIWNAVISRRLYIKMMEIIDEHELYNMELTLLEDTVLCILLNSLSYNYKLSNENILKYNEYIGVTQSSLRSQFIKLHNFSEVYDRLSKIKEVDKRVLDHLLTLTLKQFVDYNL